MSTCIERLFEILSDDCRDVLRGFFMLDGMGEDSSFEVGGGLIVRIKNRKVAPESVKGVKCDKQQFLGIRTGRVVDFYFTTHKTYKLRVIRR